MAETTKLIGNRFGPTTFTGTGIELFQALAVANALDFWVKHHMTVNRAYTPKAMMKTASDITGLKFKPRDFTGAAKALREHAAKLRAAG